MMHNKVSHFTVSRLRELLRRAKPSHGHTCSALPEPIPAEIGQSQDIRRKAGSRKTKHKTRLPVLRLGSACVSKKKRNSKHLRT